MFEKESKDKYWGDLYQTFSDDELEHIFMSAYGKNNKR